MTVGLVWAQSRDGVIGVDGRLPWHLPEDLARFRALTMGSTVVMGRTTWESLPQPVRPLPGRRNVVLTRRPGWSAAGALVEGSVQAALDAAPGDVWVIGGASVFTAAAALADRAVVTEIDQDVAGDTVAPKLDGSWAEVGREPPDRWLVSRSGLRYRIVTYARDRR